MMTPCKYLHLFLETSSVMYLYFLALSYAGKDGVQIPAFVTPDGGINSGFMIAHCTSAALGQYILREIWYRLINLDLLQCQRTKC